MSAAGSPAVGAAVDLASLLAARARSSPERPAITFEGESLVRRPAHKIVQLGMSHVPEGRAILKRMTVLDNLMLGRHVHMKSGVLSAFLYWGLAQKEEVRHRRRVEDIIDFLKIQDLRRRPCGSLAYGLQKRVELGRALALDPKVLLLDEPMGGCNHEEKEDMARFVLDVNQEWGATIILIEHKIDVVMTMSDRISVMHFGSVIAEGNPMEIQRNPEVRRAYLGGVVAP